MTIRLHRLLLNLSDAIRKIRLLRIQSTEKQISVMPHPMQSDQTERDTPAVPEAGRAVGELPSFICRPTAVLSSRATLPSGAVAFPLLTTLFLNLITSTLGYGRMPHRAIGRPSAAPSW
jgi:hypothetical protein